MKRVKDKYRGTPKYFLVMAELVRAAQYRGVTTYQDIAVIMGLPQKGVFMGTETGHVLGENSENEVLAGRPMLSAVAVGVSGRPGSGFYALAKDLGRLAKGKEEEEFWSEEIKLVYEAWRRPLPKE